VEDGEYDSCILQLDRAVAEEFDELAEGLRRYSSVDVLAVLPSTLGEG
jgi:hypothetical protein